MQIEWLPIESAPTNGAVVMTDCGFVRYTTAPSDRVVDSNVNWYECYSNGELKYVYENIQYSYPILANPTLWINIKIPPIP